MTFDYKKEYKEFYMPKKKPELVEVPEMKFIAVRGKGNPNEEGGAYKEAIGLLYGIAFTIKMSKKTKLYLAHSFRGSNLLHGFILDIIATGIVAPKEGGNKWKGQ